MKSDFKVKKFFLAAHRGGKSEFHGNTLGAFQHGLAHHANTLEMDLRFDHWNKRFYLEHDFFHSPKDRHNIIEKVIPFLPDGISLFVELKSVAWLREYYIRQFLKSYDRYFQGKHSIVISYNPFVLYQLRKLRPEIPIGYICGNFFWGWVFRTFIVRVIKLDFLFLHRRMLRSMFDFARRKKMIVVAFGINKPEALEKTKGMDLAGIVTDFPEQAAKIIKNDE